MSYMTVEDTRKIKSYIVGAGYTISSLSNAIGMTRESLSSRINGKIDFSRMEMAAIADKLKKKPEDIFFNL